MATLKDVATRAGVSVSTVSLVMNGRDAGRVKPAIGERVRRAAAELGYAPNLLARSLRTRQTNSIGLLSDMVASTPFAGRMLKGAQEAAWEQGCLLLLIDTGGHAEMEQSAVQALVQRNVDALIYASMYHREIELPEIPEGLPLIVLDGRPVEGDFDWVVPDERGGARAAVEHLMAAGHTRIGFCTVDEDIPAAHQRLEGFRDTLGEHFEPSLVMRGAAGDVHTGQWTARELLSRPDRPTALFCYNDRVAMGAYRAARHLGLAVPDEVSIVGFDDQEYIADALEPGLTTVALPHYEMGAWAASRLLTRAEGDEREHKLMPCPLVVRDSVTVPR
ncbi:LacI family transcriptional regulator [Nonomuraea polychroma]|uniref:LacI family transcriptional regulator n=1 Tax=Nonomuraea polychroma TaxID=46176 RepID=A0A438M2T1_9ACTN|nr:LacI family DNA-binding transcriptional regulator [Nonomuraea polychroma]RVX40109.1 LacI family transcriptional regulator [Nonomuraea polychroma]